ncbi:MAG TPA: glycosyltransferase family 4 protein [Armatimonadota bacterium]|jgi:glycosyltransferase involved in cell wall biosynthesis
MRIAFLSESFSPVVNGVSVSVDTLASGLQSLGHSVCVLAPSYPGFEEAAAYPVIRLPSAPTPGVKEYRYPLPFSPPMSAALRRFAPDVLHTQAPFVFGWAGLYLARRLRVPLVTTLHTLYAEYVHYVHWVPAPLARWAVVKVIRGHCNRADAVIVPTDPIRDLLRSYGVRRGLEVVPTGIPLDRFAEADPTGIREAHGIPLSAPLALYAGRLAQEKNLPTLLDAFRLVLKARPEARLLMVGGGPNLEQTRHRAEAMGIGESVHFAGAKTPDETRRYYRAADLFLYASVTDTQGLVLCEALAAGLPCVAADRYGTKAVVREGLDGFRVEPEPAALSEGVLRLIDDPELRSRMSRTALEGAQRFSTQASVERLLEVYRSVL